MKALNGGLVLLIVACGGASDDAAVAADQLAADPTTDEIYARAGFDDAILRDLATGSRRGAPVVGNPMFRKRIVAGRYEYENHAVDVDTGRVRSFGVPRSSFALDSDGTVYYDTPDDNLKSSTVWRLEADGSSTKLVDLPGDVGPEWIDEAHIYFSVTQRMPKSGGAVEVFRKPLANERDHALIRTNATLAVWAIERERIVVGPSLEEAHDSLMAMPKLSPGAPAQTVTDADKTILGYALDDANAYWCEARIRTDTGFHPQGGPPDQRTDYAVKRIGLQQGAKADTVATGNCGRIELSKSFVVWASDGKLKWAPR